MRPQPTRSSVHGRMRVPISSASAVTDELALLSSAPFYLALGAFEVHVGRMYENRYNTEPLVRGYKCIGLHLWIDR